MERCFTNMSSSEALCLPIGRSLLGLLCERSIKACSQHMNRTELSYTMRSLVTRVSVTNMLRIDWLQRN